MRRNVCGASKNFFVFTRLPLTALRSALPPPGGAGRRAWWGQGLGPYLGPSCGGGLGSSFFLAATNILCNIEQWRFCGKGGKAWLGPLQPELPCRVLGTPSVAPAAKLPPRHLEQLYTHPNDSMKLLRALPPRPSLLRAAPRAVGYLPTIRRGDCVSPTRPSLFLSRRSFPFCCALNCLCSIA